MRTSVSVRLSVIVCAIVCAGGAVGCSKTVKKDVARFDLGPGRISQPAPASSDYTVRVERPGERGIVKVPGTEIHVARGTSLGFENANDGLYAFAGTVRFAIEVPEGATVKWQTRYKKRTQLATNLRRARQYTLWSASYVGAAMLDSAIADAIDGDSSRNEQNHYQTSASFRAFSELVETAAELSRKHAKPQRVD